MVYKFVLFSLAILTKFIHFQQSGSRVHGILGQMCLFTISFYYQKSTIKILQKLGTSLNVKKGFMWIFCDR